MVTAASGLRGTDMGPEILFVFLFQLLASIVHLDRPVSIPGYFLVTGSMYTFFSGGLFLAPAIDGGSYTQGLLTTAIILGSWGVISLLIAAIRGAYESGLDKAISKR